MPYPNKPPVLPSIPALRPCVYAPETSSRSTEIAIFNNRLTELAMICPKISVTVARVIANPNGGNDDIRRIISSEIEIMVRNLRLLQAKLEQIGQKGKKKKKR